MLFSRYRHHKENNMPTQDLIAKSAKLRSAPTNEPLSAGHGVGGVYEMPMNSRYNVPRPGVPCPLVLPSVATNSKEKAQKSIPAGNQAPDEGSNETSTYPAESSVLSRVPRKR